MSEDVSAVHIIKRIGGVMRDSAAVNCFDLRLYELENWFCIDATLVFKYADFLCDVDPFDSEQFDTKEE